jgi:DNA-damage-inducible protein D
MVKIGSGAELPFDDGVKLSHYACYLIVQNADPSKEIVATGQTYLAIQTRLQEIGQMNEYKIDENKSVSFFAYKQKRIIAVYT